jgi:hypothetical protein
LDRPGRALDMIDSLERWGARLLSLAVPRTTAAADQVYGVIERRCLMCGLNTQQACYYDCSWNGCVPVGCDPCTSYC